YYYFKFWYQDETYYLFMHLLVCCPVIFDSQINYRLSYCPFYRRLASISNSGWRWLPPYSILLSNWRWWCTRRGLRTKRSEIGIFMGSSYRLYYGSCLRRTRFIWCHISNWLILNHYFTGLTHCKEMYRQFWVVISNRHLFHGCHSSNH